MNKKFFIYCIVLALTNPQVSLIAGSICCKQKNRRDVLVQEFSKSIESARRKYGALNNVERLELFKDTLKVFYDLIEDFKKEDNNPQRFINLISDPRAKDFFDGVKWLHGMGEHDIICGSIEELIYRLYEFECSKHEADIRQVLFRELRIDPLHPKKKMNAHAFMKMKEKEQREADVRAKLHMEMQNKVDKAEAELTEKQKEEHNVLCTGLIQKFKDAMYAYDRYFGCENEMEQQCLNDAFEAGCNLLDEYKKIDNNAEKFILVFQKHDFFKWFENLYTKNAEYFSCGSTEEFVYKLFECKRGANPDATRLEIHKALSDNGEAKKTYADFLKLKKKAQEKERQELDRFAKKEADAEKRKNEYAALLLQKEEEARRLDDQRLLALKIAELEQKKAAEEKAEQERAAIAKAAADKLEQDEKRKIEKAERRKQRIIDERASLQEIEAKRLKESQKALADLARAQADQAKKEQEAREALLLEEQKRAAEKLDKIKQAAAKESQLAELEETWKSQHNEKIKRKAITQWQHAARHVEKAMENAQALCEKNIKKHAVHAWLDAMKQQRNEQRAIAFNIMQTKKRTFQALKKLIDQKKELEKEELAKKAALEKAEADRKAQALEREVAQKAQAALLFAQKLQLENAQSVFKEHMKVKLPVQNITPLTDEINTQAAQTTNYSQWCSDHIDSEIYLAAYNYLFNKSSFKSSKPRIKLACQLCDAQINKQALENGIKDLHWSSFTREREYQAAQAHVKKDLSTRYQITS